MSFHRIDFIQNFLIKDFGNWDQLLEFSSMVDQVTFTDFYGKIVSTTVVELVHRLELVHSGFFTRSIER